MTDKPLRPSQCRAHLRRELAGSFRAIVQGFVKQAESGSVPHFKLTNELLREPLKPKQGKSPGQRLLEELERMDRETTGPAGVCAPESGDVWRD